MSLAKLELVAHHEIEREHDGADHGKDKRHVEQRRQAVDERADRLDHEQKRKKGSGCYNCFGHFAYRLSFDRWPGGVAALLGHFFYE